MFKISIYCWQVGIQAAIKRLNLMNESDTQRLHPQPKVSALQTGVFIRGDLMIKPRDLIYLSTEHDVICQHDANTLVANSYKAFCTCYII